VVYAKPPIDGGPEQILKYLARYTYRVAISNDRLESIDDGQITFRYQDYARGRRWRRMTLTADEFLQRLALHILPRGFVRVRAFGFLANCRRLEKLALIRRLLDAPAEAAETGEPAGRDFEELPRCPRCGEPALRTVERSPRPSVPELVGRTYTRAPFDTS